MILGHDTGVRAGRVNLVMVAAILLLLAIGVVFIFSAGSIGEVGGTRGARAMLYRRQMVWALAGMACFACVAMLDYRNLASFGWLFYGVSLVLLVAVLLVGERIYGARRWLDVGVPGVSMQPAELAKIGVILALGQYLRRPELDLGRWRTIGVVIAIVAVPMVLIVRQPDLGTAFVLVPIAFAMLVAAGVPWSKLAVLAGAGVAIAAAVLAIMFLPERLGASPERQKTIMRSVGINPYQRERVVTFLDPGRDPLRSGWNLRQSQIAVGSGGFWGKGFRRGDQNVLEFLPKSVAPTDFIFSVIAEEAGFVGSLLVTGLFAAIVASGMWTALLAGDRLGRLLCTGVVTLLFCHVMINIGMTVGVFPVTGVPLPLISYGGTFMVTVMAGLGLIQCVYSRS
jgi:rod shape determining protein RodA